MNIQEMLKEILEMEIEETTTFKLSDTRFLFVDCWDGGDDELFTSLELNKGYEDSEGYVLEEVLECGTYDFKNEKDIFLGLEYMINCSK